MRPEGALVFMKFVQILSKYFFASDKSIDIEPIRIGLNDLSSKTESGPKRKALLRIDLSKIGLENLKGSDMIKIQVM